MRNARLCRLLASQGTDVVCATISLFHEVQRWNRDNIPGYCEIYLQVPMPELRRRDFKGVYARTGDSPNVVGLDLPAELPEAPDLVLENHGSLDSAAAVERIWTQCVLQEGRGKARSASQVTFGTKAETLETLAPLLRSASILPQARFSVSEWRAGRTAVLASIARAPWGSAALIVRSSARDEDGAAGSQAGRYDSVLGVRGPEALAQAIDEVIASFGAAGSGDDQFFVQPMLDQVAMAGVAFSRRPGSGDPYYIINYDVALRTYRSRDRGCRRQSADLHLPESATRRMPAGAGPDRLPGERA